MARSSTVVTSSAFFTLLYSLNLLPPNVTRILIPISSQFCPSPEAITNELGERLPFWDKSLDLVILTHPDYDHLAGLVEVLRRYEVKQVMEPGIDCDSPAYQEWLKLIEEKGIKRTIARAGQRIELGAGIWLDILHPPADLLQGTDSDTDNNGVVLRLVYGEVSFLFTADIYQEGEQCLLRQGVELESAVLKVAHHGSDTSSSLPFLNAVSPQLAVISVGEDNPYHLPDEEVRDRLEQSLGQDKVYLTSERGTIELISDGHELWLKTERSDHYLAMQNLPIGGAVFLYRQVTTGGALQVTSRCLEFTKGERREMGGRVYLIPHP